MAARRSSTGPGFRRLAGAPEPRPAAELRRLGGGRALPRRARPPRDRPFFGHSRRGDVEQGFRDAFWLQGMACGHRAAYECIAAFSATDFRTALGKLDVPTLMIHGDDDQIVPFAVGGRRSVGLVDGAVLVGTANHRPWVQEAAQLDRLPGGHRVAAGGR